VAQLILITKTILIAALLNVAGGFQLGNSSTSTVSLRYTRTNGGITADAHYFVATANTPNHTWIEGGYMTNELAGTVTSPNSGYPYFENYAGQGSATAKAFGFVNKTSGNFTSGDLLYTFNLLRTGQIRFNQYTTSTSFTGTAAGYLAFNSSGDIITTANGGVGGSGTTDYVARWTGANTLGIGTIYDNGTYVGVGATSLGTWAKFQVGGNIALTGTLFSFSDNLVGGSTPAYLDYNYGTYLLGLTSYYGDIRFVANVSERMRITGAGNVGIGTTSPAYKLDVRTGNDDAMRIVNSAGGNNNGLALAVGSGTPWIDFWGSQLDIKYNTSPGSWNGGANRVMTILSGGSIGIGTTSPVQKLQVNGSVALNTVTNGTSRYYTYPDANHAWYYDDDIVGSSADVMTYYQNFLIRYTDTTNVFLINSSGNVGIGTISPSANLVVYGSSTTALVGSITSRTLLYSTYNSQTNATIEVNNSTTNGTSWLVMSNSDNTSGNTLGVVTFAAAGTAAAEKRGALVASALEASAASNVTANLIFYTNNAGTLSEKMRIAPNGNVGIGTTNPLQLFQVAGNISLGLRAQSAVTRYFGLANAGDGTFSSNDGVGTTGIIIDQSAGGDTDIYFKTGVWGSQESKKVVIKGNGNVGIGTTSPSYKLDVTGDINFSSTVKLGGATVLSGNANDVYINSRVIRNESTVNQDGMYIGYGNTGGTSGHLRFFANGTNERMRIDASSGNLGIGTASPGQKLSVYEDIDGVARLALTNPNAGTSAKSFLYVTTTGNRYVGFIQSGANTTGTTSGISNASLSLIESGADSSVLLINAGGTIAPMVFATNGTERMRILSGGNVGIGSTSPAYKLDVAGTARTQGMTLYGFATGTSGGNLELGFDGSQGVVQAYNRSSTWIPLYLSGQDIRFNPGGVEKMRLDSVGNLGIGTTSPSNTLVVNGSQRSYNGSSYEVIKHGTFALNDGTAGNFNHFITVGTTNVRTTIIELTLSEENIGHNAIRYTIISNYDDLADTTKRIILPLYSTDPRFENSGGSYGGAVHELQMWSDGSGTMYLRLVVKTTGSGATPNWYWTARLKNCDITDTPNSTGVDTATYGIYRFTQITQRNSNVGIGTTNPSSKLAVNGSIQAYLADGSGTVSIAVGEGSTGASANAIILESNTTSNTTRIYNNGTSTSLYIGSTGTNADVILSSVRDLYFNVNNSANVFAGTTAMYINTNSNVGIGTTSPSVRLHVVGASILANGTAIDPDSYNGTVVAGSIQDGSGWTLTGIGGNAGTGDSWSIGHNGNHLYMGMQNGSAANTMQTYIRFDPNRNLYLVESSGNVGIGTTSPSYKLDIVGTSMRLRDSSNVNFVELAIFGGVYLGGNGTGGIRYVGTSTNDNFALVANNDEKVRITTGGNVGIGSTSPAYKLDVSGTIRATADVVAYSDARVKDNITTVKNALDKIKSLRGVNYTRKDDETKSLKVGVIAQEVLPILPEVVQQDDQGNYSVAYGNMVGVLIEAIKEQQRQIEDLKYLLSQK